MTTPEEARQAPLIEAMHHGAFYPHEVDAPVEVVRTHISHVFLAGAYAYKLKRPLNLGFLDYTTLAKRKSYCQAELDLNRRYAPQLYREVRPIGRRAAGYVMGSEQDVVDYVVCMRRFDEADVFSRMFADGRLESEHLRRLAVRLADIHAQAPRGPHITRFGSLGAVRKVVEDNYRETAAFVGCLQTEKQLNETRAYTDRLFSEHADWFLARCDGGFIRECHGDLHLNNVCWFEGDPCPFDCIEFNEAFRFIDVLYDVAFMVMDLVYRDRLDLAFGFLNTYLERTGDYAGARLIPFYVSLRAYVRAKVYSLMSLDEALGSEARHKLETKAAGFYRLAWRFAQPRHLGMVAVAGFSGAGKSTVAAYAAGLLGAIHLRSDALRKHLGDQPLDSQGDADLYDPEHTRRTYAELIEQAVALARTGMPVIVDAKFDRQTWRAQLLQAANEAQLSLHFCWCRADEPILRHRLTHRIGDVSDATADLLPHQFAQWQGFEADEPVFELDTDGDWQHRLREALAQVLPSVPAGFL
ncbi:AAA family ATPase [Sulfidibacter corallicola]|uniref:AAA family ATPase n=1 Tax=Sulfidibacter corallicola TaxID=2818388 RepID=A0A8A4TIE6_SULCO|nr:AAA family ATPase [Sulfidibacter corallicola]QTD49393.1 AAA family ATPase [Sulfidibacter corallicola]